MKYQLPPSARPIIGRMVLGTLWDTAERLEGANRYEEIRNNSCQYFRAQNVVMFESDLDIDADGSDAAVKGDTYIPDTALKGPDGRPLSSLNYPFMVLPGKIKDGRFNLQDLGLQLGDIGIAIYKGNTCPFIFGDIGPRAKIGEGSRFLARRLGINDSPTHGGVEGGVISVCFPGSAENDGNRTRLQSHQVLVQATLYWNNFVAAGHRISANEVSPGTNQTGGLS